MLPRRLERHVLVALMSGSALLLVGCAVLGGGEESEGWLGSKPKPPTAKKSPASAWDEQELKLAKLWARVDELEEAQSRQKEKLAILEKGLTLGLPLDELKAPAKGDHPGNKGASAGKLPPGAAFPSKAGQAGSVQEIEPLTATSSLPVADSKSAAIQATKSGTSSGLPPADHDEYVKALASAHDQYRAGRWARAIVEYTEIGKRFGSEVNGGMHLYFIAASWAGLKEYNQARQHFQDFIKDYPQSPWVPRAKVDLGRVYRSLGLSSQAIATFQGVIAAHPYSDAAEMAKMEMTNKELL